MLVKKCFTAPLKALRLEGVQSSHVSLGPYSFVAERQKVVVGMKRIRVNILNKPLGEMAKEGEGLRRGEREKALLGF